jgi:uncharacterized iron-regulated membrane protein
MRVALLIVAAIALLGLGSLLRRFGSPLGPWVSFVAQTLLRLISVAILVATAVAAAAMGGWFIAITVLTAALAVSMVAITGIHIWVARKYGIRRDK